MVDAALALPPEPRTGLERLAFLGPAQLLAPAVLFSTVFFIIPLAVMLGNSFTAGAADEASFSLENYREILTDEYYWEVLFRTIRIGLLTTFFALLLSYPAALYLFFSESRWRRIFLFIIVSPLFVSVIVRTYGWIVLLSPNGVVRAMLPWDVRLLHTEGAIVLGLTHIYIPFMVLALYAAMVKIDKRLLSAAASLGASNLRIFRDVIFPMSVPGVVSGCVIVFSISMTAFSTPVLLGGAAKKTMPYLIYQQNLLLANWQLGSALAFVLLFVTLVIVRGLSFAAERGRLQESLR